MKTKQVIVMRKDLNMRKGKMVAQGAHASMGVLLKYANKFIECRDAQDYNIWEIAYPSKSSTSNWLNNSFTKVCVSVDSEEELLDIQKKAIQALLPYCLITDNGVTEFGGVPTITCCAIGPAWEEDIDEITGHLKLL